jgi:hypothetical protein
MGRLPVVWMRRADDFLAVGSGSDSSCLDK